MHYQPKSCAVFGIAIGKTLFHVVDLDVSGPLSKKPNCQSTLNVDPLSASKTDPLFVRNWPDAA